MKNWRRRGSLEAIREKNSLLNSTDSEVQVKDL